MATELAFAYVIDVTLLREPTSVLASIGCGVIFVGVVAAAGADVRRTSRAWVEACMWWRERGGAEDREECESSGRRGGHRVCAD